MTAFRVITPGAYTTVQDFGRFNFQHMGVPVSGVLDKFSATAANLLVGNHPNTAVLEITVIGPAIEIQKEMDIALTGAKMNFAINKQPTPQWKTVRVTPGDTVTISVAEIGCRAYLAFSGGIDVPKIMDSRSTYVMGRLGGFNGRTLKKDDLVKTKDIPILARPRIIPDDLIPELSFKKVLRVLPGPQEDYFDQELNLLFSDGYKVTTNADRMGYRLEGNAIPFIEGKPPSIVTEPSIPGSIQIPPNQQPIILLVEQTVGGYAKIATVISCDISRIAQTIPGNTIHFKRINLTTAHKLFKEDQRRMKRLEFLITDRK